MDLLAKGQKWLIDMDRRYCSSPIIYKHGADEYNISAKFGRTDYEVLDEYGVKIAAHSIDFIIPADTLDIQPGSGDRIIVADTTYEVMSIGSGGCWRWCDGHHIARRIHTKET